MEEGKNNTTTNEVTSGSNFIDAIIQKDLETGKRTNVATRFPPEPNGYLHIGHAKSICLNFGLAKKYHGTCNLRFDDTNPCKEDTEYMRSIEEDIRWLGFKWDRMCYASDYFDRLFEYAVTLIKQGKAYVCELTQEQMREYRGTLSKPGINSPYRDRSVEENLELFYKMRDGAFEDGSHTLRAKIDMASPNINMRDPIIYRIRKVSHPRTGDKWCIYPMYDFTHCLSDSLENITHSICTLEFEDHRLLYDWFLDELKTSSHPQQIEFARLNLNYTVMSKRKLLTLVKEGYVSGWDDPRLPTISGLRRRGYTPESIRNFAERIGVTKADSCIDAGYLEYCVREDLEGRSKRVMGVLDPIKVVITNWPQGKVEMLEALNHPQDPSFGTRQLSFSGTIYIDRDDFKEEATSKYFRLAPGKEVRLRYSYIIKCDEVIKDSSGNIVELRCSYDPDTLGKNPEGRKVKGIIHWVDASNCLSATVRLYDRLFSVADPSDTEQKTFIDFLNKDSLKEMKEAKLELSLKEATSEDRFQFERLGYFCLDKDSSQDKLVFNRIVTLKDTWAKIESKGK